MSEVSKVKMMHEIRQNKTLFLGYIRATEALSEAVQQYHAATEEDVMVAKEILIARYTAFDEYIFYIRGKLGRFPLDLRAPFQLKEIYFNGQQVTQGQDVLKKVVRDITLAPADEEEYLKALFLYELSKEGDIVMSDCSEESLLSLFA